MPNSYQSGHRVEIRYDYLRSPVIERRFHMMAASGPRWPGELVQCGGDGLCRECYRERAWKRGQTRGERGIAG